MLYVKEGLFLAACVACVAIVFRYLYPRDVKKQSLLPQWEGQSKRPVPIPVTQKVHQEGDGQGNQFNFSDHIVLERFYLSILTLERIVLQSIKDGPKTCSPTRTQRSLAHAQLKLNICRRTAEEGLGKSAGFLGIGEALERCKAELERAGENLSNDKGCSTEIENIKQALKIPGANIEWERLGEGYVVTGRAQLRERRGQLQDSSSFSISYHRRAEPKRWMENSGQA